MCAPDILLPLQDDRRVGIRPATPDDSEGVQAFVRALSLHSRYQRFLVALRELPEPMLQRVVRGPRKEHAALVAVPIGCDVQRVVGLAELARAVDGEEREIAVVVSEDWRRAGLARALVRTLADEARCRGWTAAYADIRRDNLAALRLANGLGAVFQGSPYGPTLTRITVQASALTQHRAPHAPRTHPA
jgi:acetyltransferase